MHTHEELIPIYEHLQKKGCGTAKMDRIRAEKIFEYITKVLQRGSVFDASCGRGILLEILKKEGYVVWGSEASGWLVENVLKKIPLPVFHISYDELDRFPHDYFDAVISNDVLEHLLGEEEVAVAMGHLARISKKHVLVSVGLNQASRRVHGKTYSLHNVVKRPKWWKELYSRFCVVHEDFVLRNSYFLFGEKHAEVE